MSAFDDLIADPSSRLVWLLELYPLDTNGDEVPKYVSSEKFATASGDSPASQLFEDRLAGALAFSSSAINLDADLELEAATTAPARILQHHGDLDNWRSLRWAGTRAVLRLGGYAPALGRSLTYTEQRTWKRLVDRVDVQLDAVTITFRDQTHRLTGRLQPRVFRGTDWCYGFAGAASCSLGLPSKLNLRNDLCIEAWVYPASIGSSQRIVGNEGGATYPYRLNVTTAGAIRFLDSSGTIDKTTTMTLQADRWYHLSVNVNGTELRFRCWDDVAATETIETFTVSNSTRPTMSGTIYLSPTSVRWSGMLDEVRFWNASRSLQAVRRAQNRELRAHEVASASLVGYYKLNDGGGTTATDSASSAANGTISGGGSWLPTLQGRSDSGLDGEPRPVALGAVFRVPAVQCWMDVYEVHHGLAQAIDTVREGDLAQTINATYTNMRTFLLATTPAGQVDTCTSPNGSWVRFGTPPVKPVRVDLRGDASPSYVATAGELAERLLTAYGREPLTSSEYSTSDLSDLASANTATCGFWASERTTWLEAVQFVLRTIGATFWASRADNTLRFARVEEPTGTAVITLDEHSVLMADGAPRLVREVLEPTGRVVIGYRRTWGPLQTTDLAGAVVGTANQFIAEREWRRLKREDQDLLDLEGSLTIERDGAFALGDDAAVEAERLLDLWGVDQEVITVEVLPRCIECDVWDLVAVSVRDLSETGALQTRLGLDGSALYRILQVEDVAGEGTVVLRLWRPLA